MRDEFVAKSAANMPFGIFFEHIKVSFDLSMMLGRQDLTTMLKACSTSTIGKNTI